MLPRVKDSEPLQTDKLNHCTNLKAGIFDVIIKTSPYDANLPKTRPKPYLRETLQFYDKWRRWRRKTERKKH